jgi:putative chitinase
MFNRTVFFDCVRVAPFGGFLSQDQVDGMEALLVTWEESYPDEDLRHLAYPLATTKHETANTMQPIAEYGKGEGKPYGVEDSVTHQIYYGRGFCQLTWVDNYIRADAELDLTGERSCYWHADNALELDIASRILFRGMMEGWFRTHEDGEPETLARYFSETRDDPFNAREIINGDRNYSSSVSGKTIGELIADYHDAFHDALVAAHNAYVPKAEPGTYDEYVIRVPAGTPVQIVRMVNQDIVFPITPALAETSTEIETLRTALIQMVDEKSEYMRINNLGDPETQHTIKAARAALKGSKR